jgi:hypothetical protein
MLSGLEITRLLHQFEGQYLEDSDEHGARLNHEMGLRSTYISFPLKTYSTRPFIVITIT